MKKNALLSVIALGILVIGVIIATCGCDTALYASAKDNPPTPSSNETTCNIVSFEEAFSTFMNDSAAQLNGYILKDGYVYFNSTPIGSIHTYGTNAKGQTMMRNDNREIVYNSENTSIYVCEFGAVETISLHAEVDYCGVNNWLGIIYRIKDDVFLISLEDNSFKKIASDVECVISCEYSYDQATDCNTINYYPLFLMKDGSIKVYTGNDILNHPMYEGGYINVGSPIC